MRGIAAASVLLAAASLATAVFMPAPVLAITSDDGQIDRCWRVQDDDRITLVFTNSMVGGDVRERFRIDGDTLVRVSFEAELEAAAEYYAYDQAIVPIADGWRVVLPEERFEHLPVRIDARGEYRLRIDGAEASLSDGIAGSSGVVFAVEDRSMIARWGCGG